MDPAKLISRSRFRREGSQTRLARESAADERPRRPFSPVRHDGRTISGTNCRLADHVVGIDLPKRKGLGRAEIEGFATRYPAEWIDRR